MVALIDSICIWVFSQLKTSVKRNEELVDKGVETFEKKFRQGLGTVTAADIAGGPGDSSIATSPKGSHSL